MNDMSQSNLPSQTLETAAAWLARIHGDDANDQTQREFEQWLAADEAHRLAYADASAIWYGAAFQMRAKEAIQTSQFERVLPKQSASWAGRSVGWMFGILLVAGFAFGGLHAQHTMQNWQANVVSRVGEQRSETLADGSQVRLDSDTALRVEIGASGERKVNLLRGAAEFIVTHNETRPFVIEAGAFKIEDLGTRFILNRTNGGIALAVSEGEVAWSHPQSTGANLLAGEQVIAEEINRGTKSFAVKAQNDILPEPISAWTRGQFLFSNAPLTDVVSELDRHLDARIVLMANQTQKITLLAPHRDPLAALELMAQSNNLTLRKLPGVIFISN